MQDLATDHQNSDEQPDEQDDDYLYVCPACSVLTFEDVDECAACGSTDGQLTSAVVAEGDE